MRTAVLAGLVASVVVPVAACGDHECRERLEVDLPAGRAEGLHRFLGEADGRPFRCEYLVSIMGGEVVTATDRGCDGARLRIEHLGFDIGQAARVTAILSPAPTRVDYRFELDVGAGTRVEDAGVVEPAYEDDGCRVGAIAVD